MHLLQIAFALLGSSLADDSLEKLISAGYLAKAGEFPYQVGLKIDSEEPSRCGGALISATYILTAARCVDGHSVGDITAYVGNIMFGRGTETKPETKLVHPDYDPKLFINDIALLRIDSLKFSKGIRDIGLPKEDFTLEGMVFIASGWGQTSSSSQGSRALKYTKLFVLSQNACAEHFSVDPKKFSYPVLCATAVRDAFACTGDWGGPLMLPDTKQLIGIISSGPENCSSKISRITVLTKVFEFREWIMDNTGIYL